MKALLYRIPPGAVFAVVAVLIALTVATVQCKRSQAAAPRGPVTPAAVVLDNIYIPSPPVVDYDQGGDECGPSCDCGCAEGQPCYCFWKASQERKNFLERWQVVAWQRSQQPRVYDPDEQLAKLRQRSGAARRQAPTRAADPFAGDCSSGSCGVGGCSSGSCGSSSGSCSSGSCGGSSGRGFFGRRGGRR